MEEVKPVMVKFIETKYVHADAAHFKSVVQSLTGKDSAAAAGQSPVAAGRTGAGTAKPAAWQQPEEEEVGTSSSWIPCPP